MWFVLGWIGVVLGFLGLCLVVGVYRVYYLLVGLLRLGWGLGEGLGRLMVLLVLGGLIGIWLCCLGL